MKKDEIVYLKHIYDAITDAQKITLEIDENRFAKDIAVKYATVRCIEIIGEASKKLSKEFKQKYDDIEWRDLAGMRDKMIHDYAGIDYEIVWSVLKKEFPELKKKLEIIMKDIESQ